MKIWIIWWTRWFWLWLANYIKDNTFFKDITITWRNVEYWKEVANKHNLKFSNNNEKIVKNSDIIVFSVPISSMEKTIKKYAPKAKNWSIILDVCSIKNFPSKAMKKYAPKDCLIIPTHPMFWPYIQNIAWQIIVLTPEDKVKKDKRYILLKNFLLDKWVKVIETSPLYHDKMMAVVQGLTHINMFVIWETIKRLWIDIKESLNFVSPIYKLMISSVARYVWHDAKLYADIQMYNKEVLKVHKTFKEVIHNFNHAVETKNEDEFISIIEGTKKFFWNKTEFWQKYTDKIIYFQTQQVDLINKNIWKKLKFENIYSWKIINDIVIKFEDDKIYLKNWEILDLYEYVVNK